MLAVPPRLIMCLHDLNIEISRHYLLANLMCLSGGPLDIEKWFKQTHCVRYFTNIHFACFTMTPVEKSDTMC